jgi:hypothetical protein
MSSDEYNGLMEAILSLQAATAGGFARVRSELRSELRSEIGSLRGEMMRRFDRVESRLGALESKRKRPRDRE